MLASAMMLNPGNGLNPTLIVIGLAAIGFIAGVIWIWRITALGDDVDRSFFRYRKRR